MNTDNCDESSAHPIEAETIESWTFLGDDSTNPMHEGSGIDNIVEQHDEETKLSSKTSRSNSSCLSENFLTVTNHGVDGDISDGISVISDCDSINDRHSPMPVKMGLSTATTTLNADDFTDETDRNKTTDIEDIQSYLLVERSTENQVQTFRRDSIDRERHHLWNPSNIILFGLIIGAAAILSSQCWKINLSHDSIIPEMSLLAQRIQDLESENFALKVEVNRLVELHHAGHDHHSQSHEKVAGKRPIKQKKVWTGADDGPIHIPKVPVKENYCKDEYLNSDDLFASYNFKKCENIDESKKYMEKVKSVDGSNDDDGQEMASDHHSSQQFESRRKKNLTKGDTASVKREKFAESKIQNAENPEPDSETDSNVRNEKFVKFQEERQKLFDEATQK